MAPQTDFISQSNIIGILLSVVVIPAANTYDDMKAAINKLDNSIVKRSSYNINEERNRIFIYLDKGYDFQEIEVYEPIKDMTFKRSKYTNQ